MFEKIKQLKNLRDNAKQMKDALAEEVVNASTASGKVNLVMNGNQEVLAFEIDPSLLVPEKKEELENALKEAVNDCIKKVQRLMAEKIQAGGFNIPGLT